MHAFAGTRLGTSCWPPTFEAFLDVADGLMPTANQPLKLVLASKLAPADMGTGSWAVTSNVSGSIGSLSYWKNATGPDGVVYQYWSLVVPRVVVRQVSIRGELRSPIPASCHDGFAAAHIAV